MSAFTLALLASASVVYSTQSGVMDVPETVDPDFLYTCRNRNITPIMFKRIGECPAPVMFTEMYFLCMSIYYLNDALNETTSLKVMCVAHVIPEHSDDSRKYMSLDLMIPHNPIICANISFVPEEIIDKTTKLFCRHFQYGWSMLRTQVGSTRGLPTVKELMEAGDVIPDPKHFTNKKKEVTVDSKLEMHNSKMVMDLLQQKGYF